MLGPGQGIEDTWAFDEHSISQKHLQEAAQSKTYKFGKALSLYTSSTTQNGPLLIDTHLLPLQITCSILILKRTTSMVTWPVS